MRGLLGGQAAFEHRFDHLREEPAVAGQYELTGVRAGLDLVQQAGIDHRVHRVPGGHRPGTRLHPELMPQLIIVGHGHCALLNARGSCCTDHLTGPAQHLKDAFNIKAVRDLGTNKYFLWAQAITKLAD